jgi:predicted ATP-grasp superfamily ATP-dependent carboligase
MRSTSEQSSRVAIFGASTRAAAFSAIRAGLTPRCWDSFADADLKAVARVEAVRDLGDKSILHDAHHERIPIVYTGGMENHRDWLRHATDAGRLWGNSSSVVKKIRDPENLFDRLMETRLPALEVRSAESAPEPDGSWMLKPLFGAGGRGITKWVPEAAEHSTLREAHFFQKRADGVPYSATFIGHEPPGDVNFVGICRQLVGWDAMNAPPFAFSGSIGPSALSIETEHLIRRTGNILMWKFHLRGLFGCDFVIDQTGTPWLTEVNPRYPASAEIYELACGFTLMRTHAAAFKARLDDAQFEFEAATAGLVGKGVLYASRRLAMPALDPDELATPAASLGRIADAPQVGKVIEPGEPICTLLVEGTSESDVSQRLCDAAAAFGKRIDSGTTSSNGHPLT